MGRVGAGLWHHRRWHVSQRLIHLSCRCETLTLSLWRKRGRWHHLGLGNGHWLGSLSHFLLPHGISTIWSYWWLFSKNIGRCIVDRSRFWDTVWCLIRANSLIPVFSLLITEENSPIALTHLTYITGPGCRNIASILRAKYILNYVEIFTKLIKSTASWISACLIEEIWVKQVDRFLCNLIYTGLPWPTCEACSRLVWWLLHIM